MDTYEVDVTQTRVSEYVEMFGSEKAPAGLTHRRGKEAFFPGTGDLHIDRTAAKRAMLVLKHRYEEEVREIYLQEAAYLTLKAAEEDSVVRVNDVMLDRLGLLKEEEIEEIIVELDMSDVNKEAI